MLISGDYSTGSSQLKLILRNIFTNLSLKLSIAHRVLNFLLYFDLQNLKHQRALDSHVMAVVYPEIENE